MTDVDLTHGSRSVERRQALPLVGVAGLRGKSTIVWLLESMLTAAGQSSGVWSSTGVYVNRERQDGELRPWSAVLRDLTHGKLDFAVQELETTLVTSVGLPEGIYPLAAVSTLCGNNEDCLISPEAAQGELAQSIVARAVRSDGILILNADDNGVLAASEKTKADVILFALHPENPAMKRHLDRGGSGVWLEDGEIVIGNRLDHRNILSVSEAQFTLDGSLIFQVQNLLCAVALAAGLDLPDVAIRAGVIEFSPDPDRLPGSCNIIRRGAATILVDSARQIWTLRSLIRGIRHQPHRRTVIVADCFSHLAEPQIIEAGRLLGRLGGVVILHAHDFERALLDTVIDGIAQNEIPPVVLSMHDEAEAITQALRMLGDDGICLVITDDPATTIDVIERS